MRRRIRISVSLFAILLLAASGPAQDFKIRAKVDLVVVPVTVKSGGGRLVHGLTRNDFIILEDGRQQTITNFSIDPVPLSAAVVVNTGLSSDSLSKVQQTFTALAGAFSEFDEVAIYRYDKFVSKICDFSNDLAAVETVLKTLRDVTPGASRPAATAPGGPFSTIGPVINGAPVIQPGQIGIITTSPQKNPQVLNDAIFAAATDLAKRERNRRKMVLVISDGQNNGNDHSYDETAARLLETEIQVYAIGLDQPAPFRNFSVLGDFADATGGDVFFVNSIQHIESAYALATEEARNQYILGYMSNNEITSEGPVFRDIKVTLRRADVEARHRKGYYQYP